MPLSSFRHIRLVITLLAVLASVSVAGSAAGAKAPNPLRFGTRGTIVQIAADGPRVALATTKIAGSCDRVVVWNEKTGSFFRFKTIAGCPDSVFRPGLVGIALAGTRVAWLAQDGGNNLETWVEKARLGQRKSHQVAYAENGNGAAADPSGDYLDNLYGHGSIIAYNSWHACDEKAFANAVISACEGTPPTTKSGYVAQHETLWTLTNGRRARVLRGANARDLVAVGAGRLVVAHGDVVEIYSATGTLEQTIPDPWVGVVADAVDSVGGGISALSGNLLALRSWRKNGSGNPRLDVYDIDTAKLKKHVSIPRNAVLRDMQGSIAVLVNDRTVYAIDVLTGKRLTITAPGSGHVDAAIERPGLFYSYGLKNARGAVDFVPFARLERQLH